MRVGEVFANPASGERAVVLPGTDEANGDRLVVGLYLRPKGGMVGRHYHPVLHERFRVIQGEVSFHLNGKQQTAHPGQDVDIPPGILHDFWNSGESEALVRIEVSPAQRFMEMIRNGFGLAQDGKTDNTGKPSLLQISLFAREFDDVIRYDKGPRIVQQILFGVLAPIARSRGLRGSYPEYITRPASQIIPLDQLPAV